MKTYWHVVRKQIQKCTKNIWDLKPPPNCLLYGLFSGSVSWIWPQSFPLSPTISNIASYTVKFNEICIYLPFRSPSVQSDLKLVSWWAMHGTEYPVMFEVADCALKGWDWKKLRDSLPLWLKLPPESFESAFSYAKRYKPPVLLLGFLLSAQLEKERFCGSKSALLFRSG